MTIFKYSKKLIISFGFLVFILLVFSSISVLGCNDRPIHKKKKNEDSTRINKLATSSLIKEINLIKEKVKKSPWNDWKNPARVRKYVIINKLQSLEMQLWKGHLKGALYQLNHDIIPKLTQTWVINTNLQNQFANMCEKVSMKINALINPDINPPNILLTPNKTLTDGEAIGGFLIEWQVTDDSGLLNVLVKLNDTVIASYDNVNSVNDNFLLPNIPGTTNISVTATDNNNLVSTNKSTIKIIDDDVTAPTVEISYFGQYTDENPGIYTITIEDLESGIGDVSILTDNQVTVQETLSGQTTKTYQLLVPYYPGTHLFSLSVTNNDNDWNGDQESYTTSFSIEIQSTIPVIIIIP